MGSSSLVKGAIGSRGWGGMDVIVLPDIIVKTKSTEELNILKSKVKTTTVESALVSQCRRPS